VHCMRRTQDKNARPALDAKSVRAGLRAPAERTLRALHGCTLKELLPPRGQYAKERGEEAACPQ